MDRPRCDHIPLWSTEEFRCLNPASVRVLHNHNARIDPEYRDRCPIHVRRQFGPSVDAVWDAVDQAWLALG